MKNKIVLQRTDIKLIDYIFQHGDSLFSVHFRNYEDTVWCNSISDIYIALEQFRKNGCVSTDENGELTY